MNLRLPLPLRRALLAAMCVLGSQAFAAEYTASTLEEFQAAWNQMANGDTLNITGSIDFEGIELSALPADAAIVLKSDGHGKNLQLQLQGHVRRGDAEPKCGR